MPEEPAGASTHIRALPPAPRSLSLLLSLSSCFHVRSRWLGMVSSSRWCKGHVLRGPPPSLGAAEGEGLRSTHCWGGKFKFAAPIPAAGRREALSPNSNMPLGPVSARRSPRTRPPGGTGPIHLPARPAPGSKGSQPDRGTKSWVLRAGGDALLARHWVLPEPGAHPAPQGAGMLLQELLARRLPQC